MFRGYALLTWRENRWVAVGREDFNNGDIYVLCIATVHSLLRDMIHKVHKTLQGELIFVSIFVFSYTNVNELFKF